MLGGASHGSRVASAMLTLRFAVWNPFEPLSSPSSLPSPYPLDAAPSLTHHCISQMEVLPPEEVTVRHCGTWHLLFFVGTQHGAGHRPKPSWMHSGTESCDQGQPQAALDGLCRTRSLSSPPRVADCHRSLASLVSLRQIL